MANRKGSAMINVLGEHAQCYLVHYWCRRWIWIINGWNRAKLHHKHRRGYKPTGMQCMCTYPCELKWLDKYTDAKYLRFTRHSRVWSSPTVWTADVLRNFIWTISIPEFSSGALERSPGQWECSAPILPKWNPFHRLRRIPHAKCSGVCPNWGISGFFTEVMPASTLMHSTLLGLVQQGKPPLVPAKRWQWNALDHHWLWIHVRSSTSIDWASLAITKHYHDSSTMLSHQLTNTNA